MENLEKLAKLVRYFILTMSSSAGSGHPTSSLSGADLMIALMFGGFFKFDIKNSGYVNNDRLIFSKGHASPLFYALWAAANAFDVKELDNYRKFGSPLEGHPTIAFPYTEAATGSLGQGLSIGAGMALAAKLDNLPYKTFVLLGDSEMAEGSQWEAMALAAHYKLDNLVGIIDVNRLGQRGETMYGHDLKNYEEKIKVFGWETIVVDGHNFEEINSAFEKATNPSPQPSPARGEGGKPAMIIAKTIKGKGVSFLENKDGWHGKTLSQEDLQKALLELGKVDLNLRGGITEPQRISNLESRTSKENPTTYNLQPTSYPKDKSVATRKAYGHALARIYPKYPNMVVLDAEVSNSTYAEIFREKYPQAFFEMFIAEQNMVSMALGLARRGKLPFVSTFAAFFTRAFDQIRMSQYSEANIKFCGSHAGVSIGEDGASQMGLEDIAMFRTLLNSVVLYPSDAVSAERLVEAAAEYQGIVYIRTTRKDTPVIYVPTEEFKIGGSKTLRQSSNDRLTVVTAGVTLHEALKAYEELKAQGIMIRVIDLYSVKPLDIKTLKKAAAETGKIITVEDHYAEGGLGEAVVSELLGNNAPQPPLKLRGGEGELGFASLAVRKMPRSGKPDELLDYEEISSKAIVKKVKQISKNE